MPVIRLARPLDAAALARLHGRCFPDGWDADTFSAWAEDGGVILLLAEREGESEGESAVAGFVAVRQAGGEAEILTLAVHPAGRRAGLGARLLGEAMRRIAAAGAHSLFLEVAGDNAAALALYAGAGFVQVGKRERYYPRANGVRQDALVLRAALPAPPIPA
jgi:ribosomal-protein-alanine N-acetyltransferase